MPKTARVVWEIKDNIIIHGIFPAGRSNNKTFILIKTKDTGLIKVLKYMKHVTGNDNDNADTNSFSFISLLIPEGKYTELMNISVRIINEDGSIGDVMFTERVKDCKTESELLSSFIYYGRLYNDRNF